MVEFTIPPEVVLLLFLLPGYVFIRTTLYFGRYAGPVTWPEYEKTALSLIGSVLLLALLAVGSDALTIQPIEDGLAVETTVSIGWYLGVLPLAVVLGWVTGSLLSKWYLIQYGIRRELVPPLEAVLRRVQPPVPVRVVTAERELVGQLRNTDLEWNVAVLRNPWLVVTADGGEHRKKMGSDVYVAPEEIVAVYFGAEDRPTQTRREKIRRYLCREGYPYERAVDRMTISRDRLKREDSRVIARGVATNTASRPLAYMQVKVIFEDRNENTLGIGYDSYEWCKPGESWRFEVAYETDVPNRVSNTFRVRRYNSFV